MIFSSYSKCIPTHQQEDYYQSKQVKLLLTFPLLLLLQCGRRPHRHLSCGHLWLELILFYFSTLPSPTTLLLFFFPNSKQSRSVALQVLHYFSLFGRLQSRSLPMLVCCSQEDTPCKRTPGLSSLKHHKCMSTGSCAGKDPWLIMSWHLQDSWH